MGMGIGEVIYGEKGAELLCDFSPSEGLGFGEFGMFATDH
jgi:hypothetical protein